MGVYIGTAWYYYYDFTQSDYWWVQSNKSDFWWSTVSRNSSWFYISSWTAQTNCIIAPSEIYRWTPKKIIVNYNKTAASWWTWMYNINDLSTWYFLPRRWDILNRFDFCLNWTVVAENNLWVNPTGDVTWEMDIDSSTTNWTVTHKITGVSNVTDNTWILKATWESQWFTVKITNWDNNLCVYIKNVTIKY